MASCAILAGCGNHSHEGHEHDHGNAEACEGHDHEGHDHGAEEHSGHGHAEEAEHGHEGHNHNGEIEVSLNVRRHSESQPTLCPSGISPR